MNRAAKFNLVVSIVLTCGVACGESDHSNGTSPSGGDAGRGGVGAAGNDSGGASAGSADETPGGDSASGGVLSGGGGGAAGKGGSTQGGAGKGGNSGTGGYACNLTDPDVCVCEAGVAANGSAQACPASDCCVKTSSGCACKQPGSAFTCMDVKNYVSGAVIIPSCPP
jgi:hypothetical protein